MRAPHPSQISTLLASALIGLAVAARAAEPAAAPAQGEVSYEDVLAHPDDQELNYRFARAQVAQGDLKGAAATLERMLLIDRNRTDVRLLYAVVLYRLDNFVEAGRELDLLAALDLPEPMAAQVRAYRDLVSKRSKKTHLSGRLAAGVQYDSNRNAAPSSGSRLFLDTPIPLTGTSQRQDDFSKLIVGGLDLRRIIDGRGHEAFASVNYYRSEQNLVKPLNLQAYSVQAGAALSRGRNTLTPALVFDHVLLAQSTYLRDRGVDVRLQHDVSQRGDVFAQIHDVFEEFVPTQAIPTAAERTGVHVDTTVGGDVVLTPKTRVGGGLVYGVKHAEKRYDAFDRYGATFNAVWLPGRGTFVLGDFDWYWDTYYANDPFVSLTPRRDESRRVSGTFGAPLSLVHPALKDLIWTLTYEYYHGGSNLQNFSYFNHKVSMLLTYKWDLGF